MKVFLLSSLCSLCLCGEIAFAEPPVASYLFPAGGRRGATVDLHVGGLFLSIWTDSERYTPVESIRRALEEIDAVKRETAAHPSDLMLAITAADAIEAHRSGRIAASP